MEPTTTTSAASALGGAFLEFRSCSTNEVVLSFEIDAGKVSVKKLAVETVQSTLARSR